MSMFSSVDKKQISHFAKNSKYWWDENGPFKPLHKLNPVRFAYIKQQILDFYGHDKALEDLKILDVGCGGGLICESLARLGINVTGLDADTQAIEIAKEHAKSEKLEITYLNKDLINQKGQYDVVLSLEVIEHVSDIQLFIKQCVKVLKPGGLLIYATINRTAKSYAFGILAAEYIFQWIPKGTHSWNKLIKPSELVNHAQPFGLTPKDISGMIYNPLKHEFSLSEDNTDINYLISFISKP